MGSWRDYGSAILVLNLSVGWWILHTDCHPPIHPMGVARCDWRRNLCNKTSQQRQGKFETNRRQRGMVGQNILYKEWPMSTSGLPEAVDDDLCVFLFRLIFFFLAFIFPNIRGRLLVQPFLPEHKIFQGETDVGPQPWGLTDFEGYQYIWGHWLFRITIEIDVHGN